VQINRDSSSLKVVHAQLQDNIGSCVQGRAGAESPAVSQTREAFESPAGPGGLWCASLAADRVGIRNLASKEIDRLRRHWMRTTFAVSSKEVLGDLVAPAVPVAQAMDPAINLRVSRPGPAP